jgi:hypothetical protein
MLPRFHASNGRQTLQHWQKHLPGMGGKLCNIGEKTFAGECLETLSFMEVRQAIFIEWVPQVTN